jgi:hypothetical protein
VVKKKLTNSRSEQPPTQIVQTGHGLEEPPQPREKTQSPGQLAADGHEPSFQTKTTKSLDPLIQVDTT